MKATSKNNPLLFPVWLIVIFLAFVALSVGKSLIITLIFTTILLVIFSGMYGFFQKMTKSHLIGILLTAGVFVSFFWGVGYIISSELQSFSTDIWKIGQWLDQLISQLNYKGYGLQQVDIKSLISKIDFASIGTGALGTISWIVGGIATVAFLLVFLMMEKNVFAQKIRDILPEREEATFFTIAKRIYDDMNTFFLSKFGLAMFNAIVSVIVMKIFGLEYALMFALLVFLLDFIPAIGGIIALGLPFLYSFVQFDNSATSFILLACLFIPQTFSWNFLEPRIMGNRLNLSGFVIMVSLIFWSWIWGITWAFLAVPLMASINIVLANFKTTRPLAVLLSKNGKIKH